MQDALVVSPPKQLMVFSIMAWMALAVATPSHVANYDFRHFNSEDSLTISFSRSSPPLAILEDEKLSIVQTEPTTSHKQKGATEISSGTAKAWPRLQHYARLFEKDYRWSQHHKHSVKITQLKASSKSHGPRLAKVSAIRELIGLVQPIIDNDLKTNSMGRAGFNQSPQIYSLVHRLAAAAIERHKQINNPTSDSEQPMNVRDHVEEPLTTPSVPRGLPRGEDAPPVVIQEDQVGQQAPGDLPTLHVIKALSDSDGVQGAPAVQSEALGGGFVNKTTPTTNPLSAPLQVARGIAPVVPAYGAPPAPNNNSMNTNPPTQPSNSDNMGIYALDGGRNPSSQPHMMAQGAPQSNDDHRIIGQVELTGGLAATGYSTKLNVQWKTGSQTRDANIDYSSGQFIIDVPNLEAGKVIATIVDDSGRTLGRGDYDLDGVATPGQKTLEGVSIVIDAQDTFIKGQVRSAYSVDNVFIPVKGAEVFGPSQTREAADDKGSFRLSGLNSDSTLLLDSYATDYWGTRVLAAGRSSTKVPLFADKMVESFLDILGQSGDSSSYGIVWGVISHKGKPVAGAQVALSDVSARGPIYFNELRIPDKNLTSTSTNGLYAFIKVKPGLDIVEAQYNRHELPSTVVSVSPSMVSYSEISFKSLNLMGRVFDPVSNQNISAQMSVVGTSKTTRSDANGFNLKIPSSDPIIFIEGNPGPGYMVSREAIPRADAHEINLMAYKKDWVVEQYRQAGMKYNESKGTLLGYVEAGRFTVRLDDAADLQDSADANDQNAIYFDENGTPDPSMIEGVASGGVFMMTNLKPGLHTLVITSASGEMATSRLFVSEGGVLNVLSMPLRP